MVVTSHPKANLRTFWLILFCWVCQAAQAQVFSRLYPDSSQIELAQPLEWIAVAKGSVDTPDQFVATPQDSRFQPYTASTALPTSATQEAWARFTLPKTETSEIWFIRIPRIGISKVSLYSSDLQGKWTAVSSGESIAPAQWALHTRVPSFEVQTSVTRSQTYYLRFEHRRALTERPMLISPIAYVEGASRHGILIGLLLGTFTLLAVLSVCGYAFARNTVFLSLGVFVITLMLSQLVLTGYGGWRLWPNSAYLNQVMGWVTSFLALAAGIWFVAQASYARDSHPWIYRLLSGLTLVTLVMTCVAAANLEVLSREMRNIWVGGVTLLVVASLAWMALQGQKWNVVLFAGLAPIGLATFARLAYNLGWVSQPEFSQTVGIFSAMLGLLWLMVALVWRSRTLLLSTQLAATLSNYDAVSGLVQERVALIRLPQMLRRANQLKLGCGVIMLQWLNYPQLMSKLTPSQQHAMLKQLGLVLNRVARDIDTAARLDDGYFMILVEGPISRSTLASLSTQILTACIRSSDKFDLPNSFNFHIAIWQAALVPSSADEVTEALRTRLNQMSVGTKRPVQFIDVATSDVEAQPNQEFNQRRDDLLAKIDAIEASPSVRAVLRPDKPRK